MLSTIKDVQTDVAEAQENHKKRASAVDELDKSWEAFKAKFEEVNRGLVSQIAAAVGKGQIPGIPRQRLESIKGRRGKYLGYRGKDWKVLRVGRVLRVEC